MDLETGQKSEKDSIAVHIPRHDFRVLYCGKKNKAEELVNINNDVVSGKLEKIGNENAVIPISSAATGDVTINKGVIDE